ncbi:hypothetical protein DUNSADRAFT_18592 [Dunaliella salina]|uniref:Uncharacterized protein n=1 Tax=Dunaliella salina TaxID=3046 RepID=A0ABQ7FZU7_DUNSA|nr:hypothetical protein DUNSADRAFT_18592 [Dunaliella salina]|eukprot:KAF5827874.1 hypothetical protein DUNSADRAFT_18592 [Dunaliella salina]
MSTSTSAISMHLHSFPALFDLCECPKFSPALEPLQAPQVSWQLLNFCNFLIYTQDRRLHDVLYRAVSRGQILISAIMQHLRSPCFSTLINLLVQQED